MTTLIDPDGAAWPNRRFFGQLWHSITSEGPMSPRRLLPALAGRPSQNCNEMSREWMVWAVAAVMIGISPRSVRSLPKLVSVDSKILRMIESRGFPGLARDACRPISRGYPTLGLDRGD